MFYTSLQANPIITSNLSNYLASPVDFNLQLSGVMNGNFNQNSQLSVNSNNSVNQVSQWAQTIPQTLPWASQQSQMRFSAQNQPQATSPYFAEKSVPIAPATSNLYGVGGESWQPIQQNDNGFINQVPSQLAVDNNISLAQSLNAYSVQQLNMPPAASSIQPNGSLPFASNSQATPFVIDPCTSSSLINPVASTSHLKPIPSRKRQNSSDSDSDSDELLPPAKMTVTEEKVAARFNVLSLNTDDDSLDDELFPDNKEKNVSGTVKYSSELNTILSSEYSCPVDKLFKDELTKNSMALVPWTPPRADIQLLSNISKNCDQPSTSNYITQSPASTDCETSDTDREGPIIQEVFDDDDMIDDVMDL